VLGGLGQQLTSWELLRPVLTWVIVDQEIWDCLAKSLTTGFYLFKPSDFAAATMRQG
jgi:hypothetical protein